MCSLTVKFFGLTKQSSISTHLFELALSDYLHQHKIQFVGIASPEVNHEESNSDLTFSFYGWNQSTHLFWIFDIISVLQIELVLITLYTYG